MNNSLFGTCVEYVEIIWRCNWQANREWLLSMYTSLRSKGNRCIDGLCMVEFYTKIYNTPIYVGTRLLDLSKVTMIKFHYDVSHASLFLKYFFISCTAILPPLKILTYYNGLHRCAVSRNLQMPFEALSVDERALKSLNIDHISQIVNLFGHPCFMVEKYSCHRRQKPH